MVLGLVLKNERQDASVNSTDYTKPIYFLYSFEISGGAI